VASRSTVDGYAPRCYLPLRKSLRGQRGDDFILALDPPLLSTVDWDLVTGAIAAGVTFLAVVVALFGWRLNEWFRRPRLSITFEYASPWCRRTILKGLKPGYWVRLRVRNDGTDPARSCIGKVTGVRTNGEVRHNIVPMQLRWCGVPDHRGFDPIHLAKNQDEFLNVLRLEGAEDIIHFETFQENFAPGHCTCLDPLDTHQVEIAVVADNADPVMGSLEVQYDGDFSGLPGSLQVAFRSGKGRARWRKWVRSLVPVRMSRS
jgi:hypothetical protein